MVFDLKSFGFRSSCHFLLTTFKRHLTLLMSVLVFCHGPFFQIHQWKRITLVAIDEESLAEIGPWPWSRSVMADLISKINAAGAQLQIHDVLYPAGEKAGDEGSEPYC